MSRARRVVAVATVLGLVGVLTACSGGSSDAVVGPSAAGGSSSSGGQQSSSSATDASTTGPTAAPTTTTTMLTTPTAIEDTLADPSSSWPIAGVVPGPTRVTFADGTDNQLLHPIFQPVLPTVPHASATAAGGQYTARIDGFEFADDASAAAWAGTFAPYQADEVADLPGNVHVERHPVASAPAGWSGYVVDALFSVPAGVQWQRTATLVRQFGRRAFVVTVRWFGNADAGVPDLAPTIAALAGAQDAFVGAQRIGPATPGTGSAGGPARLGLAELAAPWGALLGQPDVDPAAGSQSLTADTPEALPTGALPDGTVAVATRVVCGARAARCSPS